MQNYDWIESFYAVELYAKTHLCNRWALGCQLATNKHKSIDRTGVTGIWRRVVLRVGSVLAPTGGIGLTFHGGRLEVSRHDKLSFQVLSKLVWELASGQQNLIREITMQQRHMWLSTWMRTRLTDYWRGSTARLSRLTSTEVDKSAIWNCGRCWQVPIGQ